MYSLADSLSGSRGELTGILLILSGGTVPDFWLQENTVSILVLAVGWSTLKGELT